MTTLRNDYVGMPFRRSTKRHVQGPDVRQVVFDNRFCGAAALGHVTPQTADETNVVRSVDKYLDIHLLQQTWIGKDQNAFNDDNWLRLYGTRFVHTRMRFEVVKRQFNRLSCLQSGNVFYGQFLVDRVL